MLRQYTRAVVFCSLCLLPALQLNAGITACARADGSVVFQDTACDVIPEIETTSKANTNEVPLGIDKTWFDTPSVTPHQAECNRVGCYCGEYYREFKSGLTMAVADALYLDGSWHRFDAKMRQLENSMQGSVRYDELRRERNEAACNILMSQKILQLFSKNTLSQLQTKKRHAEELGWENPTDCDVDNLSICEHTDNIALYNRILSDARTLGSTTRIDAIGIENNDMMASDYLNIKIPDQPKADHQAEVDVETRR